MINDADIIASETVRGIRIEGWMYKYSKYLESGVSAANIPSKRGSGAGKSKYIDGLISYVKQRMNVADLKRQKSIAFAIATKQKKVGMPIRTHGKGTQWLTKALDEHQDDILRYVSEWAGKEMDIIFDNFIDEQQKKFITQ